MRDIFKMSWMVVLADLIYGNCHSAVINNAFSYSMYFEICWKKKRAGNSKSTANRVVKWDISTTVWKRLLLSDCCLGNNQTSIQRWNPILSGWRNLKKAPKSLPAEATCWLAVGVSMGFSAAGPKSLSSLLILEYITHFTQEEKKKTFSPVLGYIFSLPQTY